MGDFWRLVFDYNCSSIVMLNEMDAAQVQKHTALPHAHVWKALVSQVLSKLERKQKMRVTSQVLVNTPRVTVNVKVC